MTMYIEITIGNNLKRWYILDDAVIAKLGVTKRSVSNIEIIVREILASEDTKNIKEELFYFFKLKILN